MGSAHVVALDRVTGMDALEDPHWYRVARLKPRLRAHVRVQRRVTRGRVWYVLCDDVRRRFHRVHATAYQVVGRLDGSRSIEEVWQEVHRRLGEAAPTQSETLRMLAQLSEAELTTLSVMSDGQAIAKRRSERKRRMEAASVNPLFFKVPLFDPSRVLHALQPFARALFSPMGFAAWLLLLVWGGAEAIAHADALRAALSSQYQTAGFLLVMWMTYPFSKVVHELAHALSVRRWGGEIREVGVHLVLLTPLPYVDASAANGFAQRRHRVAVSAAGVMAELALAAIAVIVWSQASSEAVQQVTLATAVVCSVSTVVFNANPLTRLDGYYVLCDMLDLPNLQQRGRAMVAYLFQRVVGGSGRWVQPDETAGVAVFVAAHAVLSWCYQVLVVLMLAFWLHGIWPALALGLLVLGLLAVLSRPLAFVARLVLLDSRLSGRRARALLLVATVASALFVTLFVLPVPLATVQQGVVSVPQKAIIRSEADGEITAAHATTRDRVEAGQHIVSIDNLALRSELETATARLRQLEIRYYQALLTQAAEARQIALERDAVQARIEHLDARLRAMTVRAAVSGVLVLPRDKIQEGQFYRQGVELGYVLSEQPGLLIRVALDETQAALVRERTLSVAVRLAAAPRVALRARVERETPNVTRELPTPLLGTAAGGPVPTDPSDSEGRATLAPVVIVDVEVPDHPTELIGARAWVRFEHPAEPLAFQWGRVLKQSFLGRQGGAT